MSENPTYSNARIVRRRRIIDRAWRLLDRMRREHESEEPVRVKGESKPTS